MAQLVAVLYGVDLFQHPPPTAAAPLSVDAVATARAVKFRELELREQALTQRQLLLDRQQLQLQAEAERFQITKRQFERTLESWQGQQQSQALEETAALLAGMKPKQAKEQLLLMLQRGELESVVTLLMALPPGNRAKVVAEFQSPEDTAAADGAASSRRDSAQAMVDSARHDERARRAPNQALRRRRPCPCGPFGVSSRACLPSEPRP